VFVFCSMSDTASHPLPDRMPASFEEFRDMWAAEATRKGLVGLMQRAILRLLNALVAVLAEARERRLEAEAAAAMGAEPVAADVCVADAGLSARDIDGAGADPELAGDDGAARARAPRGPAKRLALVCDMTDSPPSAADRLTRTSLIAAPLNALTHVGRGDRSSSRFGPMPLLTLPLRGPLVGPLRAQPLKGRGIRGASSAFFC
jgi:hypothetical protein